MPSYQLHGSEFEQRVALSFGEVVLWGVVDAYPVRRRRATGGLTRGPSNLRSRCDWRYGSSARLIFGVVEAHGYRLVYMVSLGLCLAGTAILAATRVRVPAAAVESAPA